MRFLEHPGLSRLSVLVNELNVGDRLLCGKLELFSTEKVSSGAGDVVSSSHQPDDVLPSKKRRLSSQSARRDGEVEQLLYDDKPATVASVPNKKTLHEVGADAELKDIAANATGVLGTQTPEAGRELLVNLVTTLNTCFPDYDFSSVTADAFIRVDNFVSVYTSINYHLSFLAERVIPGFLNDLWCTVRDVIDLRSVHIYSYTNAQGKVESDPYLDDHGCLFSFDYFFVDEKQHRILFFSCMTKRKEWRGRDDPDSERGTHSVGSSSFADHVTDSDNASSFDEGTLSCGSLYNDDDDDDAEYSSQRDNDGRDELFLLDTDTGCG